MGYSGKQIQRIRKGQKPNCGTDYRIEEDVSFEKIAKATSSKEAWEIMEIAYRGDNCITQTEDKERVTESRVEKVANQHGKNGEPMPANWVVEKILRSLTDDFENIDLSTLSVEEIVGSLKAHEQQRRKMFQPLDQAQHIVKEDTQNTQGQGPGGRDKGDFEDNSKEQTSQQNWLKCFKCDKYDHYANEWRSIKCYNCGKADNIARYYWAKKKEKNLLTGEDNEETESLDDKQLERPMSLGNLAKLAEDMQRSKKLVEISSIEMAKLMMMRVANLEMEIARIKHDKILELEEQRVRQ
ncbi:hypothetical protein V8G54_025804 [Vigna mungo]|uniref:Uncharacterized protein n=1 Tax=Vigna mungo TaxID=3915 RepID=A0AAQ3MZN3_VIGMU